MQVINQQKGDQKIDLVQAYFKALQDPYDKVKNPFGYIVFGATVNHRVIPKSLEYLPSFLLHKDLNYCNFGGNKQFNQFISDQVNNIYSCEQTFTIHNLECAVDIFANRYKKISYSKLEESPFSLEQFKTLLEYSNAQVTDKQSSQCQIVFLNIDIGQKLLQLLKSTDKITVVVLGNQKFLKRIANPKVFMTYQVNHNNYIYYAPVHCSSPNALNQLSEFFNLHSISTLIQKAAIQRYDPSKEQNIQFAEEALKTSLTHFIRLQNKIDVPKDKIFFGLGATGMLSFIAKSLFKDEDQLSLDCPVYQGIQKDFGSRVNLKYKYQNMFQGDIMDRIKKAKNEGSKGFVIIHPSNPVGCVLLQNKVRQICEWASNNPDFVIIFDQMYINLVYEGKKTISSAFYASTLPNIITIRGFAKDFGLCGMKVGFLTSSNPTISNKYKKWKKILSPHIYTLKTVSTMLQKSQFGLQILQAGKSRAWDALSLTCQQLDKYQIKYFKPEAGLAVFLDFREYLKQHTNQSQISLFNKMFYEYKLNANCGSDYKAPQPGCYRICTVSSDQIIIQAVRRLNLLTKGQRLQE